MRVSIATSLKFLLGLSLMAAVMADPVAEPKRGRGGSSGGEEEEQQQEEDQGNNLICSTTIRTTTTIANIAITTSITAPIPCLAGQATTTPAGVTAGGTANQAMPTGALDTRYLMGAVGAGVGVAVLGF